MMHLKKCFLIDGFFQSTTNTSSLLKDLSVSRFTFTTLPSMVKSALLKRSVMSGAFSDSTTPSSISWSSLKDCTFDD